MYWEAILDGRTKGELAIYKRIIRDIDFSKPELKLSQQNKVLLGLIGRMWFLHTLLKI